MESSFTLSFLSAAYKEAQNAWQLLWYERAGEEREILGLPLLGPLREQAEKVRQDVDSVFAELKPMLEKIEAPLKQKGKETDFTRVTQLSADFNEKKELLRRFLLVFNLVKRSCDAYQEMEYEKQMLDDCCKKEGGEGELTLAPKKAYEDAIAVFEKLKPMLWGMVASVSKQLRFEDLYEADKLTLSFSEKREFLRQLVVKATATFSVR